MKKIIFTSIFLIFLSSCIDVKFEEAQPNSTNPLSAFPKELQGTFYIESEEPDEIDTISIGNTFFSEIHLLKLDSSPSIKRKNVHLSDSLILKKLANNYILNFKDKKYWSAFLITRINTEGFSVSYIDGNNENTINKLKKLTETKDIVDESGEINGHLINPSKSTLKKIIKDKKIFTEIWKLKKLHE